MKRLFKTLLAIVIVIAVIIISAVAIVSVRMSGQVKAFDKSEISRSFFLRLNSRQMRGTIKICINPKNII